MTVRTYEVEVPSIVETQLTGLALIVRGYARGSVAAWEMHCDSMGRPLAIRRNDKPYPTLATCLIPMHRFAKRFLVGVNKMATRTEQLADAYLTVARVNHYMVGITETVTDDELSGAEQLLITRQNATAGRGKAYRAADRALDLLQQEQRKRLHDASHGL